MGKGYHDLSSNRHFCTNEVCKASKIKALRTSVIKSGNVLVKFFRSNSRINILNDVIGE